MSKARFIEPMLLLRTEKLPEGDAWTYEIKFDGYRALAIKSGGKIHLRSRNDNDFNGRYPAIVKALGAMPDDTVIDGEVVALDLNGKPSFNLLQNYASGADLHFFVFDVLVLKGEDVMIEPLTRRRELLEKQIFPKMEEPIRYSPVLEAGLKDLIQSVKAQGLEGLVAKRRDSKYEPGQRSGEWQKMRVNAGQELVIAGYTPSPKNFDALHWLLPGRQANVRRAHAERVHSGIAGRAIQEAEVAGNLRLHVRQPAGEACRALGRRADCGENGGMSVAKASDRGAV